MAEQVESPGVRGWLHPPAGPARRALAITHGAGSNADAALLVAVAEAFAERGYVVLRYDLPFRQARPKGPPIGSAARDREGVRQAAAKLRELAPDVPLYLAGHSYGGRQTSMLAAQDTKDDASVTGALLLLSYPLHPPKRPEKPRTEHFPALRVPVLFVQWTRDELGTAAEVEQAVARIPARARRSRRGGSARAFRELGGQDRGLV